jgi:hypothetical protein
MTETYDALRDHLLRQPDDVVSMSFSEIDQIARLPPSAYKYSAWWANEDAEETRHVQCRAWQAAGYDAKPDIFARKVTFRRKPSPRP